MRPGVVALYRDTLGAAPLDLEQQRVVVPRGAVIGMNNIRIVLADLRVLQIKDAALILIADRGAGGTRVYGVGNPRAIQEAVPIGVTESGNVDRWIFLIPKHHVNDVAANVISGDQPVRSNLLLNAQIPLIDIGLFYIPWKDRIHARQRKWAVLVQGDRVRITTGKAR